MKEEKSCAKHFRTKKLLVDEIETYIQLKKLSLSKCVKK